MPRNNDLNIILGDLKSLFSIAAVLMSAMVVSSLLFWELRSAAGFIAGMLVSLIIAAAIHSITPRSEALELKHAIIIAALAYLLIPAVSAIPYMISTGMSPVDAYFESISGWTSSGFTMLPAPDSIGHSMQLWRSVTQWIGAVGVILLMVTVLIRPGTSAYILYQSEARKERIRPSIRSTVRTIWKVYLALTIISFFILLLAGMPAWDALNVSMTAIGGGFTLYSDSIGHYDSLPIEIVLLPVMIAGAIPFAVLFMMFKLKLHTMIYDIQVRTFAGLIATGCLLLVAQNYFYFYNDLFSATRYSVFQLVSAITSTGLQTTDISGWSPTALLIMSIAMIIGGCAGSTSGGIKVAREIFLVNQIKLWLKKTLLSKKAVIVIRLGQHKVVEKTITEELNEATLISFLWILNILVSIMLLANILGPEVSLSNLIFEVCSAQGNCGLTTGIINPAISPLAKLIFIADMWMGRLEIVPVILLLRTVFRGFGR
ncbi:TrkH family potassium uptake protein [Methanocella arvoryzae]|uniref:K(+) uptake system, membrane component n=1 Tax=Methanocella arvoryzae (strain DSM 22066 / NBRC 105507 / MRE50) TaxID=351160 RepID=Q0W7J1_METAR|nr:TrkH family potassium uptake protein [Methanocella arvoryzae]CAJ35652.1 putative K(+) uptake system, membrane component [Methanocella arvoryzae MRE50]